jgi:acyl-coenzyme A synthetase/AMP-(fatty) acid ligase
MVPSALSYMRRFFEEISFPDLRLSLFCGEALHHDLVAAWSKSVPNAHIENVYGPTEATIFCLRYVWTQSESAAESVNGIVPIGEAMPRLRTYVVDEAGQLCDDGQKGELCLSGDQVMTEYWEDPAKTETAFVSVPAENETERAYRTGDIAYSNQNGNLIYLGRLDSQIKIDGHRIELSEIEHFACKCIKSAMAVAVVSDDDLGQPEIILYVQKGDYEINDVESFLASMLPGYMLPRKICGIVEMPLNLNGKIDRKKLAAMVV